jgi:hypothetical protein
LIDIAAAHAAAMSKTRRPITGSPSAAAVAM